MRVSDYEILCDLPEGEYDGKAGKGVRTETIRAGALLEVKANTRVTLTPAAKREARERRTNRFMEKINRENRIRHVVQMLAGNFTGDAVVSTLTYAYPNADYKFCNLRELSDTYERRGLPWDIGRVEMDALNLRERLKRRIARIGGDPKALKWIQCVEEGKNPPAEGLPPKYHVHAVIEAPGVPRDMLRQLIEACWEKHGETRCEGLLRRDDKIKGLAEYMCKQKHGRRSWSHSRNLKPPEVRVSNRKISRRRLGLIAADVRCDGKDIFEKLYPGYKVAEIKVKYSDFAAGCSIYCRMWKLE